MRITIAGDIGSGKSTVAKLLAKKLGYEHYSVGDFMREIARKKKLSVLELSAIAEKDGGKVDRELDKMQTALNGKDDFVLDSRLGFHFVPKSFKVFLKAEIGEACRRIFEQSRRLESNETPEKTRENITRRKESEKKRYMDYYGLDTYDTKNYDIVVDTTKISPEQAAEKIIKEIRKRA